MSASSGERATGGLLAVDFFCGAGGMSCGLEAAGLQVVAGIDADPRVRETYVSNHRHAAYLERDIRTCTPAQIESQLPANAVPEQLVFVGCSPCQYWSRVRTPKSASRSGRTLLIEFARLVFALRPGFVVVENVPGIAHAGRREVLEPFLAGLKKRGYETSWKIVTGLAYGVPQRRPRFLLIASRVAGPMAIPSPQLRTTPTVGRFIGRHNGLRPLQAGESDPNDPLHRASALSNSNLARIRMTAKDGGDRSSWRDTSLQIDAYRGKDSFFRNVYSRMWWDRPAPTLTTRFNSLSNGRFGHPEEDRAITPREGALLQTFPNSYKFKGTLTSICRQIGNAVPPELGRAVGNYLMNTMNSK